MVEYPAAPALGAVCWCDATYTLQGFVKTAALGSRLPLAGCINDTTSWNGHTAVARTSSCRAAPFNPTHCHVMYVLHEQWPKHWLHTCMNCMGYGASS